MKLTSTRTHFY